MNISVSGKSILCAAFWALRIPLLRQEQGRQDRVLPVVQRILQSWMIDTR